ncbi:glycoside hydrolase family protein [Mycetohabitans sp. B8]|nr:glycoside hydrolase family protein [Mycetohabitans sp. B8]
MSDARTEGHRMRRYSYSFAGIAIVTLAGAALQTAFSDQTDGDVASHLPVSKAGDMAVAAIPSAVAGPTGKSSGSTDTPIPTALPTIPCGQGTKGIFYGIGGHVGQGGVYDKMSDEQQLGHIKELGMTMYGHDVFDYASTQKVFRIAKLAKKQCIGVFAALTADLNSYANEDAAYRDGLKLGAMVATTLKGVVQYYQVGNEYENVSIRRGHGNNPDDYDNASFQKARGSILGMIDGIKSANPSATIMMCPLGWLHFGFLDMLYTGTQPDGSRGHRIPKWDITAWHWYSDMGDITAARGVNVLRHLHDTYRKPIWITELGVRPGASEQASAAYLVGPNALGGLVQYAKKYNIQNVTLYELLDDEAYGGDGNYGLLADDGVVRKHRYDVIKRFIATHAMP